MHSVVSAGAGSATRKQVLFIHGLGMSSRSLVPTMERLAATFDVVAPDLPGCGRSSRVDHPLDLRETAEAVARWMDAAGVGRPVVVGHSVGAQVAAHLALLRPDRVDRLVFASPTGDPDDNRWSEALRLVADGVRETPGLVPVAVRDYVRAGPRNMWRTFVLTRDHDTTAVFRALTHRSVVVRGAADAVVSPRWAAAVADAARSERLVTIPEAPHGLPYSAAEAFAATVRTFATE